MIFKIEKGSFLFGIYILKGRITHFDNLHAVIWENFENISSPNPFKCIEELNGILFDNIENYIIFEDDTMIVYNYPNVEKVYKDRNELFDFLYEEGGKYHD